LRTGQVELMARTQCLRILTDDSGRRATGVVVMRDGVERALHADIVAVCAGLGPSAMLLLDSRTDRHRAGLGNSTGCVGRYYGGHDTGMVFPLISLGPKLPPMHTKTFSMNAYYDGGPDCPYPMGVIQAAGQVPFWQQKAVPGWLKLAARMVGERSIYCFFMNEVIPTRESGFVFDGARVVGMQAPPRNPETFRKLREIAIRMFRDAGYPVVAPRRRSLWHRVGTVRFGDDPQSSVLDATCKVHDIDGLYVVDASVLPSAGAVGTALTIAALALRTGDAIAGALSADQNAVSAARR
jgi:choline dehydrogenase-like flavoprotein